MKYTPCPGASIAGVDGPKVVIDFSRGVPGGVDLYLEGGRG